MRLLRDYPQMPLPDHGTEFCFTLTTTVHRLTAMLGVLQDGAELLGLPPVSDYNYDFLVALGAYDRCLVEDDMPYVGEIRAFFTDPLPPGWLSLQAEQTLQRADYPELFGALPQTLRGVETINLPSFAGAFPAQVGDREVFTGVEASGFGWAFDRSTPGQEQAIEFEVPSGNDSRRSLAMIGVTYAIYAGVQSS